ncbi:MAG: antitoxin VapB family protein [Candidatus Helarchaeota archaeon]
MPSKSISITVEVYELLDKFRKKNESFSQAIKRLIESQMDLMDLAGAWKKIPDAEPAIELVEKVVKEIHEEKRESIDLFSILAD